MKPSPLEVTIPGLPISANRMWRNNGAGRVYKVREANNWDTAAYWIVKQAALKAYGTIDLEKMRGSPLKVELWVERPTWRGKTKATCDRYVRPDLDNYLKPILDALTSPLGLDDCAVVELIATKREGPIEQVNVRMTFLGG